MLNQLFILVLFKENLSSAPGAPFSGTEQAGSETDHSTLSSGKVKNTWSYTSTQAVHLHGVLQ
jgi:hypothetical protein